MNVLFSKEFSHNEQTVFFTVYQVAHNLFQAKASSEILMLWKVQGKWEGVTNIEESVFLEYIGAAIDKHFSKSKIS